MLTQRFKMQTDSSSAGLQAGSEGSHEDGGIRRELRWRELTHAADTATDDIAVSRWVDGRGAARAMETTTPCDRYIIAIALKTTRLTLTSARQIIFDGIMPAGTLQVTAPSKPLGVQFHGACDFIHFHVAADHLHAHRAAAEPDSAEDDLNDLILLRDPFAEQLGKMLIERGSARDVAFIRCLGQTLAMHIARLELPRSRVNALPKWRLRRVEDYVSANFHRAVSLSDLAGAAGLSRMHFAAQFRAATGYRPREFLLHRRVEYAKSILSGSEMRLAEVALSVGFCTQAHFSTVFKRITGETPARWRCTSRSKATAGAGLRAGMRLEPDIAARHAAAAQ